MNIKDIILKKKDKKVLEEKELEFVFVGYDKGDISKAEMTEFLNVFKSGKYNFKETESLTKIMLNSGKTYNLSSFANTVDKHSTGGVSDNTTFIVVPIFALFGFTSIKMSGASLGHTGGTADKIKVFEGLENNLSQEKAFEIAKKTGACFITSSENIAPIDKKVYALRDEINAMSISLIASSVMSKKLATGNKNLVLDVKFGNGALLKSKKEAKILANAMKKIGESFGVNTSYVLGDMNQPLGSCIGNYAEIFEVIETLKQKSLTPLLHHSLKLVAIALYKNLNMSKQKVYKKALEFVYSGKVLEKLEEIIIAQGGNFNLSKPEKHFEIVAKNQGKVKRIDTKALGFLDKEFKEKYDDYKGFKINVRKGQKVLQNQSLFELYFKPENEKNIEKSLFGTLKID